MRLISSAIFHIVFFFCLHLSCFFRYFLLCGIIPVFLMTLEWPFSNYVMLSLELFDPTHHCHSLPLIPLPLKKIMSQWLQRPNVHNE